MVRYSARDHHRRTSAAREKVLTGCLVGVMVVGEEDARSFFFTRRAAAESETT